LWRHLLTICACIDDEKEKAWDVIYWNMKERGPQWIWYFILYIGEGYGFSAL